MRYPYSTQLSLIPHCSRPPCPPPPSRFVHVKSSNTTSRRYIPFPLSLINYRAYLIHYRPQTSHAAAKKAALPIRFVIVGGGAAGLACAVALRRVGHQVILLEKDSNFVGVSILTCATHPGLIPYSLPGEHTPWSPYATKYDQNLQLLGDEWQGGRRWNRRRPHNHV